MLEREEAMQSRRIAYENRNDMWGSILGMVCSPGRELLLECSRRR